MLTPKHFPQRINPLFRSLSTFKESGKLSGVVKYLPMPRLSPTMEVGMIRKWYIKPFETVQSYQLILEVSTKTLRDVSSHSNDYLMEIEILEDMLVAEIFAKEGEECIVGQPIASFCDLEEDIRILQENQVSRRSLEMRIFKRAFNVKAAASLN